MSQTYTLTLELKVTNEDMHVLEKKNNIAKKIYNQLLAHGLKIEKSLLLDKNYRKLIKENDHPNRLKMLNDIRKSHGFTEYDFHSWGKYVRRYYSGHLGSMEVQKLATRAFRAVEKFHYKKAKRVRFYRKSDFISIENKSNKTGLRRKENFIIFGILKLPIIVKEKDYYAQKALLDETKYVRIIKKIIRGKDRYYVQLIQKGTPPKKHEVGNDLDVVGIDIGVSTIALYSKKSVVLKELALSSTKEEKLIKRLNRAIERSRRFNNPLNYNEDKTIKKGKLNWVKSKRYKKLIAKRYDIYRKSKEKRRMDHEILANEILSFGLDIRVEKMSFSGLIRKAKKTSINRKNGKINSKKRFGKSIGNRAPSLLLTIINRKLGYYDTSLKEINTYKVKASQYNHIKNSFKKKCLSERWNILDGKKVQRDLYSAFIIAHTNKEGDEIDRDEILKDYPNFLENHDKEIKRIKIENNNKLNWYVA